MPQPNVRIEFQNGEVAKARLAEGLGPAMYSTGNQLLIVERKQDGDLDTRKYPFDSMSYIEAGFGPPDSPAGCPDCGMAEEHECQCRKGLQHP